ncbi:hypothetical protein GPK29_13875 [Aeromonas hydrophila]|uniref:hypothetical protein n=1 Tax=Aeromonas hydrophila TaxID=644 RepID=UPI001C5BA331|nr:hypothetical protein [Aeromonas hydrophila]MBW3795523.1 hypothetical protein [Aeromonas hydrophila]MBW3802122.1 hypothetical protein [Aeromonas hydrophila]MBW3818604.1 hypothetical protein [Aeromonas hydrophila]
MHQIFQGPVENVAGRDVNITNELGGRPLTRKERLDLNALVERLIQEFGQERKQPWQFLHQTIGINNIGEMRLEHLKPAQALLQLMIEAKEAESANAESAAWYQEHLSSERKLQEQGRVLVQLRSTVSQWEQLGQSLRQERDQLKLALDRQLNVSNQQGREIQSLASEVKRLQQRSAREAQEHRHAEAENERAARRAAGLQQQIDSLVAGNLRAAQELIQAQGKAQQAQKVVRRLRGTLLCSSILAVLAVAAISLQARQIGR